jgi:hypothetical protein
MALALVALAVVGFVNPGCLRAAELVNSNKALCDAKLDGEIRNGDFDRLKAQLKTIKHLCLSSPGGSYFDGIKFFELIAENKIATIIDRNDVCFSACAIAFMGGADGAYGDRFPDRTLYIGGTLGFHSPFANPNNSAVPSELNTLAIGVAVGVKVVAALLRADKFDLLPKALLAEMLDTDPSSIYAIDTTKKVGLAKITLAGVALPAKITKTMLYQACINSDPWYRDVDVAADNGDARQSEIAVFDKGDRHRVIFHGFDLQAMCNCAAEIVKSNSDTELYVKIEYGDLSKTAMTEADRKPAWVLFPRNQKIFSLPVLSQ